ncbi:TetR family transcriptional regulator [Nocardia spumae]|uniref:TetR family transcriptional regulator n=1 Tax=Nocardia spumae TaxID=2887190 RepID=UPI001D151FDD|nr:TetR family transcriptional regulator [Nocardia spumae]
MPRSGEHARRRLQQAALELFRDQGFDRTTAAEIAARAGVTERTFFRHFPDKREVLFGAEAEVRAALVDAVAEAPERLGPLEVLLFAFRRAGHIIESNRAFAEPRFRVIAATPALRERDLAKHAALVDAVTEALRRRGVAVRWAGLATRVGWAAFDEAAGAWVDDPEPGMDAHLDRAFEELRRLAAASPSPAALDGRR